MVDHWQLSVVVTHWHDDYTVASRYLDPAYLDPITYVQPMSESAYFPYIFIVFQLSMSRTSFKSTLRLSRHHFQSVDIFFTFFTTAYLEPGSMTESRKTENKGMMPPVY